MAVLRPMTPDGERPPRPVAPRRPTTPGRIPGITTPPSGGSRTPNAMVQPPNPVPQYARPPSYPQARGQGLVQTLPGESQTIPHVPHGGPDSGGVGPGYGPNTGPAYDPGEPNGSPSTQPPRANVPAPPTNAGPATPAAPAGTWEEFVVPGAEADVTYQAQSAALQKSLEDYQTADRLNRQQYRAGYDDQLQGLGYTPGRGWVPYQQGQYSDAYSANVGDFSGRGLGQSSYYLRALGDLNDSYTEQKSDMDTAKTQFSNTADNSLANFKSTTALGINTELMDAVARLAAHYGVDTGSVGTGKEGVTYRRRTDSGATPAQQRPQVVKPK